MARLLDDASNQYLADVSTVGLTAYPYSWGGWFNRDAAVNQDIMGFYNNTAGNKYDLMGLNSSDALNLLSNDGGSTALATATISASADTWQHALAVIAGTQDRSVYLDGANKGVNTTDNVSRTDGLVVTAIGRRSVGSPARYFSGMLAEFAAWNAALTDAEAAVLKLGVQPHYIRPDSIVGYWRVMGRTSPEIDQVGGYNMTVTGATVADHPPMMFRPPVYVGTPEAAADYLYHLLRHKPLTNRQAEIIAALQL